MQLFRSTINPKLLMLGKGIPHIASTLSNPSTLASVCTSFQQTQSKTLIKACITLHFNPSLSKLYLITTKPLFDLSNNLHSLCRIVALLQCYTLSCSAWKRGKEDARGHPFLSHLHVPDDQPVARAVALHLLPSPGNSLYTPSHFTTPMTPNRHPTRHPGHVFALNPTLAFGQIRPCASTEERPSIPTMLVQPDPHPLLVLLDAAISLSFPRTPSGSHDPTLNPVSSMTPGHQLASKACS
jgi:hypothetical protein